MRYRICATREGETLPVFHVNAFDTRNAAEVASLITGEGVEIFAMLEGDVIIGPYCPSCGREVSGYELDAVGQCYGCESKQ